MTRTWPGTLLGWVAGAALLGCASAAIAQLPEPTYRFELRPQSVGSALRLFGEVTHQQIIFSEDTVKGRRSGAVVGNYTATQALALLLARTGLKITRTETGVFYVGNGVRPDDD